MCKESWSVGLGQKGFAGARDCLKYLKSGWNRKEGRGNKDFKKGGRLGQGAGVWKMEGVAGTPLGTMAS